MSQALLTAKLAVPEALQDELKARAREGHTDEPVTLAVGVQYQHDLDTRATALELDAHKDAPERRRPSPAEQAAAIHRRNQQNGQPDQSLSGPYLKAAKALAKQAADRQQKRKARQRTRSRVQDVQRRWSMPEIVVKVKGP